MRGEGRGRLGTAALAALLFSAALAGCLKPARPAPYDLLQADPYTKLIVEIDYAQGKAPRDSAKSLLQQRITERLSKPGGTTVVATAITTGSTTWSVDAIRALEAKERSHQPAGETMVLYVLYLNGHSDQDTGDGKVLGIHYGRASIAIFKESIDGSTFLPLGFGAEDMEKSVLIHEFGHVIGLVNNGVDMMHDHEDDDHPRHSTNEDSVMYWAVENTLGLPFLDNGPPNDFDSDDRADLKNAGGK